MSPRCEYNKCFMKYFRILYIYFLPLRLLTHFVNGSYPSRRRAGSIWNKEGIDRLWVLQPTFKINSRKRVEPLESGKSFLKCQKEKRDRKKNERKKTKQKEKLLPVHISKVKTENFVSKLQGRGESGDIPCGRGRHWERPRQSKKGVLAYPWG